MIIRSLITRLTLLQEFLAVTVTIVFAGSSLLLTSRVLVRNEDSFLLETAQRIAGNIDHEFQEERDLAKATHDVLDEESVTGVRINVADPSGRSLYTPTRLNPESPRPRVRILHASARANCGAVVTVSISDRLRSTAVAALGRAFLLCAIPLLVVSLLLSRWIARRGLRPLAEMGQRAQDASVERGVRTLGPMTGLKEIDALREAFDRLLVRLDDLLQSERRFTADASHELRTPLTVLSGEIEMARADRHLSPAVRAGLERAADQARAMLELVEALLLLRRTEPAEPGKRTDLEPVNLSDLLAEILLECRRRDAERAGDITSLAPDEALVGGHPALLSSALRNLVDNALKFTQVGEAVRIMITTGNGAGSADEVAVAIDDAGPGITVEEEERIFDPFYRGAEARAGRYGFGLGLPILRQVAQAHGGNVTVGPSTLGGARFVLRLPSWQRGEKRGSGR